MALTALSTISYNTENYLIRKLEELRNAHKIQYYYYIKHDAENGDKDHIHLFLQPNVRFKDMMDLQEYFNEVDINNDKPLGVMPIRPSNVSHWILYVLHIPSYLKQHNSFEDGKKEYNLEDIKSNDIDYLNREYRTAINQVLDTKRAKVKKMLLCGSSISEVSILTNIPINEVYGFKRVLEEELQKNNDYFEYQRKLAIENNLLDTFGNITIVEELPKLKCEVFQSERVTTKSVNENGEIIEDTKIRII